MSAGTLLLAAAVDLAITAVLAYVGIETRRRHPEARARRAATLFSYWWFGLAGTVLANALREILGALDLANGPGTQAFAFALQIAYVVALVVSVWGLLYYLVFLFSGKTGSFRPLTIFYAIYGAIALGLVVRMVPTGFAPAKWYVQWTYANPTSGGPLLLVMTLLLLLPQIGASLAYGTLVFRLEPSPQRRRIAIVSLALTGWLGLTLLAPFLQMGRFEWWQAGGRLVGLAASLAILYAYLGAGPVASEPPRDDALQWRVQALV